MTAGPSVRPAVKAVVIEKNAALLLHHWYRDADFYELPGGGQRYGETLDEALVREVWEETGVEVTPGPLVFVRDYIARNHEFADLEGRRHQIELVFLGIPTGRSIPDPPVPDNYQVGVVWAPLDAIPSLPLYPAAYRSLLAAGPTAGSGVRYLGDVN